ncbi:hypothetical protein M422DRAFT_201444 [Sphaerobolus stellatus SS14]|nr:hypothetical protein M422DRAFT_201444 [Sphaerobolus stellatus SS14]
MSNTSLDDSSSDDVLVHVRDVHCHPTDTPISQEAMDSLRISICAMATKHSDQALVRNLAQRWPNKVTPCFGYHPWFTHWIAVTQPESKEHHYRSVLLNSSEVDTKLEDDFQRILPQLPEPILLSDVLAGIQDNLEGFPNAMLGEVGLDRAFRIPWNPDPSVPKRLSPFTVPLEYQIKILEAQLDIAVRMKRNVSLHSVKAQQATLELFDRLAKKYGYDWDAISIDMHSCGLSSQMWKSLERNHPNVYLSLSLAINSRSPSHRELITVADPKRILAESDYNDIDLSAPNTWKMILLIAQVKGWKVETSWQEDLAEDQWGTVRKLEENWRTFARGNHAQKRKELEASRQSRKLRKDVNWEISSNSDVDQ